MLSTDFEQNAAIFLAGASFLVSAVALYLAMQSVKYARASWKYAQNVAQGKLDRAKMAEIDTSLTELTDAYDALLKSHKKLRSRIGMRENRQTSNGQTNLTGLSDERDKDKLRLQCRASGLLK